MSSVKDTFMFIKHESVLDMKEIILFTLLAIFGFKANAQDEPTKESDISFGLKGGLNFAMITGEDTDGLDGKIAFHIGVVNEIRGFR